ncbi:MAG: SAM-dependent methyltransferase [Betaproteobacteria bacterium]|nr:SAM-dependent methyltransferase [Betaproteobacteria bacterium]
MPGKLILIPVPLGTMPAADCLPAPVLATVRSLQHFIAESAKTARAFLKTITSRPVSELSIHKLRESMDKADIDRLLAPLQAGHSVGLLSEAGMPCIADPGQILVRAAHERGIRVEPLVGPTAIVLALAASGLIGQRFAFHGYLPVKEEPLRSAIEILERNALEHHATQIMIEAPYRNDRLLKILMATCRPATRVVVAADLTLPSETILAKTVERWRKEPMPALDRRPAVFLIGID